MGPLGHGGTGWVEWETLSHSGCELELRHTQVVFPTVQDDPGLGDTMGCVGKRRACGFRDHLRAQRTAVVPGVPSDFREYGMECV